MKLRHTLADKRKVAVDDKNNLREHQRVPLNAEILLHWRDETGLDRITRGKCVDISSRGIGALADDCIPVRTYVHFQIRKIDFSGSASVRFASRKGLRYIIGLELSGVLQWKGETDS